MIGRKLKPDETVHHIDGNKLNNDWRNLQILTQKDHGAVSSRQRWYFKQHDIKLKKDWDEYFEEANQPLEGGAAAESAEATATEEEGDVTFP